MKLYLFVIMVFIGSSSLIFSAEKMDKTLVKYIANCLADTNSISESRKLELINISNLIKTQTAKKVFLNMIDESNSHISVLYQNMGKAIAIYLKNNKVDFNSYGLKATEYSENAVRALKTAGFCIFKMGDAINTDYDFRFELLGTLRTVHSLKLNDKSISKAGNISIFLTSKVNESKSAIKENTYFFNCDSINNELDNTKDQKIFDKYCRQISIELCYLISNIN